MQLELEIAEHYAKGIRIAAKRYARDMDEQIAANKDNIYGQVIGQSHYESLIHGAGLDTVLHFADAILPEDVAKCIGLDVTKLTAVPVIRSQLDNNANDLAAV